MTWRFSTINVTTVPGGGGGTPGGEQPTVSIDFSASTIGTATLTSDARYRRNTSKNLEQITANSPRFQCGIDGLVKGILIERANTGYLKRNNAFSVANGWTQKDITQVSAARASIFGTNSAYEFEETATATTHVVNRTLGASASEIPDNTPICLWAIVEHVDMDYVMLMFRDKANRFPWQRFNIHPDGYGVHTSSPGSATQYSAGVEYVANDRFLIWGSWDSASATSPSNPTWHLHAVNSAGDSHSFAGSGRSYILNAAGANLGYYPQVFFPLTDAHVSKVADVLTLPAENQAANDFYGNIVYVHRDVSMLTGSAEQRYLYHSGNFSARLTDDDIIVGFGANELTASHTFVPGGRYNIAWGKGPTQGLAVYINGELKASNTGAAFRADISPGTVFIGSDSSGANQIDAVLEAFAMGVWE